MGGVSENIPLLPCFEPTPPTLALEPTVALSTIPVKAPKPPKSPESFINPVLPLILTKGYSCLPETSTSYEKDIPEVAVAGGINIGVTFKLLTVDGFTIPFLIFSDFEVL